MYVCALYTLIVHMYIAHMHVCRKLYTFIVHMYIAHMYVCGKLYIRIHEHCARVHCKYVTKASVFHVHIHARTLLIDVCCTAGGAYDVMASKHLRGDINLAWPTVSLHDLLVCVCVCVCLCVCVGLLYFGCMYVCMYV